MQKALAKQKTDIDLVMELNKGLKFKTTRLEEKLAKAKEDIEKEKKK